MMTHYTLDILFCIPTVERFKKLMHVRTFVAKVHVEYLLLCEMCKIAQWLKHDTSA